MDKKEWQKFSDILKSVLSLELDPVAINCCKGRLINDGKSKLRICRAILEAASGACFKICKDNNACFGAGWHLGFHQIKDPKVFEMIKQFVVEGEKLFSSYEALDNLISQMPEVPDNSECYFELSPLCSAENEPELVVFVCTPETACRLLTLVTFDDGAMPKIKIGGPTCRMAVIYPLLTGEVNISFYDYTARKMCAVDKDKLLISIPYKRISGIVSSLDNCTAGVAKIEYPQEFREFLKKRLAK